MIDETDENEYGSILEDIFGSYVINKSCFGTNFVANLDGIEIFAEVCVNVGSGIVEYDEYHVSNPKKSVHTITFDSYDDAEWKKLEARVKEIDA